MSRPLPTPLAVVFEAALNRYLALDPDSQRQLATLSGKAVAVELTDLGWEWVLLAESDSLRVHSSYEGPVAARLCGSSSALLHMSRGAGSRTAFSSGTVEFNGDVELGQRIKALFDNIEIDWEEHLSKLTGDVVAHNIGHAVRRTRAWGTQTLATLVQDFAEYQQQEARNLPAADEVAEFLSAVDTLRDDTARVAQRIARLQQRLQKDSSS